MYSRVEIPIMVKMSILCTFIYRANEMAIKIQASFVETGKPILKFIWKCKLPRLAKMILRKNKIEELMLSEFKTYYKSVVIQTV